MAVAICDAVEPVEPVEPVESCEAQPQRVADNAKVKSIRFIECSLAVG